jgi:hypothetical protein
MFDVGVVRVVTGGCRRARFGFAHANDPVPNSTLTPLTAAMMQNQVTAGFTYNQRRSKWEWRIRSIQRREYDDSAVKVGTQWVMVGYSFRF